MTGDKGVVGPSCSRNVGNAGRCVFELFKAATGGSRLDALWRAVHCGRGSPITRLASGRENCRE